MLDSLFESAFRSLVRSGSLEVATSAGRRLVFGDGGGTPLAIRFLDARAQWSFLLDPELRFGELWTDGRWIVERGTLYDVLSLLMRNSRGAPREQWWLALIDRLRFGTRRWRQANDPDRAKRNVAHHYDLGDALYELFLDADRQYSCAYFEQPGQTLEEAQLAKKRHIAAKLLLEPGHRVLDIGCGWGGMALYLAQAGGVDHVTGVTLSREQLATARRRADAQGLSDRVEFRLQDYRDIGERFDRIVSVGMFEHVGLPYYETFFRQCRRLLADDGVMLLHTIGCTGTASHADPWLDRYIFPGGYTPTLSQMMPAIEASGLVVSDIEVLRLHYAFTLRAWRERFMARRDEARALNDERFCRMWEFYLAGCETVFQDDDVVVFQVQLAARNDVVPITRDYLSRREADLQRRESPVRART